MFNLYFQQFTASFIFNYLSVLVKDAVSSSGAGVQALFGKGSLDVYLYADDTLLVGASQHCLQELLDAVASAGARYGMKLHWNKFQLLQIGNNYQLSAPDGTIIAPTDMMTYLGATIYSDGGVKKELNRKLGAAWADFCKLSRLWNHASLQRDRKIRIYHAVVISGLLYGLSTAWLNVAELRRLNGFHCRCLRRILNIKASYVSRVSNASVLEQAGENPLASQLLQQQLLLYGWLVRAPENDPLRTLTFAPGTTDLVTNLFIRRVGRPRNEWAVMLQRECWKMCPSFNRTIHIEREWRRAVYEHCSR